MTICLAQKWLIAVNFLDAKKMFESGSISESVVKAAKLLPAAFVNVVFDGKFVDDYNYGPCPDIHLSRRKAMMFKERG